MENTKDTQRNAYQLTINNPLDYGYSHNKIKKILLNKFTTLQYFCLADEIGEEGTYHTVGRRIEGDANNRLFF